MDAYEATRTVLSRIQSLDPENASKIMGLLLIQGQGEKDMIRLAFGPEALLHSVVIKARKDLGLSSPTNTNSPNNFFSNSSSSRVLSPCSSSSSSSTASWAPPSLSDYQNFEDLIAPNSTTTSSASYSSIVSANGYNTTNNSQLIDEFPLQDQLSFLNDASIAPTRNPDLFYPDPDVYWGSNNHHHRRSFSFTDACLGSSDGSAGSGYGWKPCLYYARGYCKNGATCKFLHGFPDSPDSPSMVGSPGKLDFMEQCQELLLRSKTQQQRLNPASQIFSPGSLPYSPTSSKCMTFLLQQQQQYESQRASMMLGEDGQKFGRARIEKNEIMGNGAMSNAGSRQIYLTFPADSTFREEDVSNYFNIYGPVQDVRIPFQQKRMFGFVTFVYPETVKLILAKGNPHFVCDARVLVKPYKEKGKVPDKYRKQQQQQQIERGELSPCVTTPNGFDARDPYDLQHSVQSSPRLLYNNTQDLLWRRKMEEQAEFQQALELQSRRFMGLQLLDMNKDNNQHRRNHSMGAAPIFSPTTQTHAFINQSDCSRPKSPEAGVVGDQKLNSKVHSDQLGGDINGKEEASDHQDCNAQDSLEHNLPDSPFASPTRRGTDASSPFSTAPIESKQAITSLVGASPALPPAPAPFSSGDNNLIASSLLPATSTLEMASYNSCLFQMPRFFSGQGAIQM